jgi:hypothetical protein
LPSSCGTGFPGRLETARGAGADEFPSTSVRCSLLAFIVRSKKEPDKAALSRRRWAEVLASNPSPLEKPQNHDGQIHGRKMILPRFSCLP